MFKFFLVLRKTQQRTVGFIGDVLAIENLGLFEMTSMFAFPFCNSINDCFKHDSRCRASARSELYDDQMKNLKIMSAEHNHKIPK